MKKILIALSAATLSSAAWGQQVVAQMPHKTGELAPDQVEAVQRIGQTVLGAKGGYVPAPTMSAVRTELKALQEAVEKSQSVLASPSTTITLHGTVATPTSDAEKDHEARRIKERQDMDLHLQSLRARHAELDAHAAAETDEMERSLERGASDKLLELEQELADVQAAPESERLQRLGKLQEKLTPQSKLSAGEPTEHPPTISTIVEHRR